MRSSTVQKHEGQIDALLKSPSGLSFRVKREIFILQPIEKIRFLPVVEMTHSTNLTFYECIKFPISIF